MQTCVYTHTNKHVHAHRKFLCFGNANKGMKEDKYVKCY